MSVNVRDMIVGIVFLILYLVARLLSGSKINAIGTTAVIALCLLVILRLSGDGSWRGLGRWIKEHVISFILVTAASLGTFVVGVFTPAA
ncbi:hypothetical protein [Cupriavidus sp. YAF13]|uniref:hypothetical protein n=1 Tax=Cupriavidus sp. YAF13 TaxID=3233075 RepID=UPI003F93BA14